MNEWIKYLAIDFMNLNKIPSSDEFFAGQSLSTSIISPSVQYNCKNEYDRGATVGNQLLNLATNLRSENRTFDKISQHLIHLLTECH